MRSSSLPIGAQHRTGLHVEGDGDLPQADNCRATNPGNRNMVFVATIYARAISFLPPVSHFLPGCSMRVASLWDASGGCQAEPLRRSRDERCTVEDWMIRPDG